MDAGVVVDHLARLPDADATQASRRHGADRDAARPPPGGHRMSSSRRDDPADLAAALSRRAFLRRVGLGAPAAAAAWQLGVASRAEGASGKPWGTYPSWAKLAEVPKSKRPKHVLEIFLAGGLTPWETFYAIDKPEYGLKGDPLKDEMWWTFQSGPNAMSKWLGACGLGAADPLQIFALDANGAVVKFTSLTEPLRSRADVIGRMRMHVVSHGLFPHNPAIALALTGSRSGTARHAGVGAAVQRAAVANGELSAGEASAYVLRLTEDVFSFGSADETGLHPAWARPLAIEVVPGKKPVLADAIAIDQPSEAVAKLRAYELAQLDAALTPPGAAAPVRSALRDNLQLADAALAQYSKAAAGWKFADFKVGPGSSCGWPYVADHTSVLLGLATKLIKDPAAGARHVTVCDTSFLDGGAMPDAYDFHSQLPRRAATQLSHFFAQLEQRINKPGENDPNKLDLDDTLIVLNTEFGRSPGLQTDTGRNHHPAAYVTMMFGGPIGPQNKGIVGAIHPDATPKDALTPAQTRAAVLAALGVWPFEPELFDVSEMGGATDELAAALHLRNVVLGGL